MQTVQCAICAQRVQVIRNSYESELRVNNETASHTVTENKSGIICK